MFEEIHEGLIDCCSEAYFKTLIEDYIEMNEIVLDVGGPSHSSYHRVKETK